MLERTQKIALLLMALPFVSFAEDESEKFVHRGAGIVISVPDGWDRDSRRERGSTRFSALLSIAKSKYVSLEITAERGKVDLDEWITYQKSTVSSVMKSVDEAFKSQKDFKVGGKNAAMISIGGKRTTQSGTEYTFRQRSAALVNGDVFIVISEMSYNGGHEGQDATLKALWNAIRFETPEGTLGGGGGVGDEAGADGTDGADGGDAGGTASTEPTPVEDKAGNFKLTLPAGWLLVTPPQEDGKKRLRIMAQRLNENGDGIGVLRVIRFQGNNPALFTQGTASDFLLKNMDKNSGHFERFYGENTAGTVRPDFNAGILLGGAQKSGEYEYRSITNEEEAKIAEAEKLKGRGEKIEIPVYKEIVVRGRIALISPHIYFCEVVFNRSLADDPALVAEYKSMMESWEFGRTEAMPGPLQLGSKPIGNTLERFPEARKDSALLHIPGKRVYKMQATFLLPAGFMKIEEKLGANVIFAIAAQDGSNNWVKIVCTAASHGKVGEENKVLPDKNVDYTSWASNFESKARGAKIPKKPQGFRMGVSGKGYKKLEGTIEGHRGTFSGVVADKSGWRTWITVDTRGDGDIVFEKQLKDFFRKLRFKAIKK